MDGNDERTLSIDALRMIECLDLVEIIYNAGFSKRAIADSLLRGITLKSFEQDAAQIIQYDAALQPWRGTDEFLIALFIAQKSEETNQ